MSDFDLCISAYIKGGQYLEQKNYEKARECFIQCVEIYEYTESISTLEGMSEYARKARYCLSQIDQILGTDTDWDSLLGV
jgi:hypothetical protein